MFENEKRLMDGKKWFLDYCKVKNPDQLFEACKKLDFLNHPKIEGTVSRCKRNIGVYSNTAKGYHLSKQSNYILPSKPLPDFLSDLLQEINEYFQEDFNLLLINEYQNHKDSIGPHYDDPYGNGYHGIVTISLGATRTYRLTSRENSADTIDYKMEHGDVLIMSNIFQDLYEHSIPEEKEPCGLRISITTRRILNDKPFKHVNKVAYTYTPRKSKNCVRCGNLTREKCGVCNTCYILKSFSCPKCQQPTGAPWLCNVCYIEKKHG
jgi:alkylated DNA repair dioxygenase AlkB